MKKHIMPMTIRGKIILSTATITLLIVAITVSICFNVFQTFLQRNQIQSAEYNLQVVSNNVTADMSAITYLANWCASNSDISRYLEEFKDLPHMPSIGSDQASLRIIALNTHARLKEECRNTHASKYISRVVISPENCHNFLQFSETSVTTMAIAEIIRDSDYFKPLYDSPGYLWLGLQKPLYSIADTEWILPIIRPIKNRYNSDTCGWVYVEISDRVIRDYLTDFPLPDDSSLTITIGEKDYLLTDNHFVETNPEYTVLSDLSKDVLNPDSQAKLIQLSDGSKRRLVTCSLGENNWTISLLLSEQDYNAGNQVYLLIILGIVIVIILMGLILAWLLDRTISQPVNRLSGRIQSISQGDFSHDESIEGTDELGQIGHGINHMSENVHTLMERKIEDEKQKKDLEYQILQSQINPHFLYNTLNSIKWMATIQNAPGIAEMTTALARLMKNVAKGTTAQISLKEELALVNDYVLILKYRYGGNLTVTYDIADEELNNCLIHRFSLQPLIENALFHGIEPKGCPGLITITAQPAADPDGNQLLQISVTDNGIGMDEETIRQVLQEGGKPSHDFFKHLGIHNVHTRIQYAFGSNYGISIQSKVGEYTTMILKLPYQSFKGEQA